VPSNAEGPICQDEVGTAGVERLQESSRWPTCRTMTAISLPERLLDEVRVGDDILEEDHLTSESGLPAIMDNRS
jgi:hypothetical protein